MVHSSDSWIIKDPSPKKSLSKIFPFSKRAYCLVARNKQHKLLKTNFLSISGAIDIIAGMDYHYYNFMQIVQKNAKGNYGEPSNLEHEVVAYINRVGQFYYFSKSDLVKKTIKEVDKVIPKINHLIIFRHKHTAHRSIDKPKSESKWLQGVHAMSLTGKMGITFTAKEGKELPKFDINGNNDWDKLRRDHWSKGHAGYQINMGTKGNYKIFVERDHPIVTKEAYSILEQLLQ